LRLLRRCEGAVEQVGDAFERGHGVHGLTLRSFFVVHADGDLLDDDAWRAHLFRTRGGQRIVRWARSLRWFRYCRGHASPFFTEPDRFLVALRWDGADRHAVLAALGLAEGADGWQDLAGG